MSQSQAMIATLKTVLRQQGKTYQDVAAHMQLSQASIKRLFSEKTFSLQRFEQVCEFAGMQLSELILLMEQQAALIEHLSFEQEKELVADVRLLLMAYCLLNRWPVAGVINTYQIDELAAIQLMAKLDRMKILQLLPGNRVKLMVSRDFNWLANGPIQRFFERSVQPDFLNCSFNGPGEMRVFISGMLSRQSNQQMMKEAKRLMREFNQLNREDESLPLAERFGTSFILAMRPWELAIFDDLRRGQADKIF
ncbi:MAG: AcrR family transcriptional regulator [Phenylobacterium sp.]|jgi:AcrR family transcriptional regulator